MHHNQLPPEELTADVFRVGAHFPFNLDRDGRPKAAWVELRPRTGDALLETLREKARAARRLAGKTFE